MCLLGIQRCSFGRDLFKTSVQFFLKPLDYLWFFFVIGLLYTLGKFFLVCIYQHISEISDTFSENSDMHVYLNMFLYLKSIYLSV